MFFTSLEGFIYVKVSICPKWIWSRSRSPNFTPLGQQPRNRNLQGRLTICLLLCFAEVASRLGLLEGDVHCCPRGDHAHTWIWSGTIPALIYDVALPADILPCPAGIFSGKVVSLKMMFLHYLMFLLNIIKDEEKDADKALRVCVCARVCLTMSVWNHNWTPFSRSLMKPFLGWVTHQ